MAISHYGAKEEERRKRMEIKETTDLLQSTIFL